MKRAMRKRLEVVTQDNILCFRQMSGPERLIPVVEKYPCLWDIRNENHFKKDVREAAWKKVCEEIYDDWHLKNETEKWNKSSDLRQKWTHIRDYYRKDLLRIQNLPPGMDKKKQKRYVFSDLLHFLAPLYDTTKKNIEKSDTPDSDSSTQRERECYSQNLTFDDDDKSIVAALPTSTNKRSLPSTSRNSTTDIARKRKLELLNDCSSDVKPATVTSMESAIENEDIQFLMSLRGDLKQLNHSQRLEFKIGVLQLIQKIMYSDDKTKAKISPEVQNEAEHVMSTVLKMSPVYESENSQHSFDFTAFRSHTRD